MGFMVSSVRRSVFFLGISVFSIIHALGVFGIVPAVSLLSRLLFPLVFCRRIFSVLVFVRRLSFYNIYERIVFKSFFNIVYDCVKSSVRVFKKSAHTFRTIFNHTFFTISNLVFFVNLEGYDTRFFYKIANFRTPHFFLPFAVLFYFISVRLRILTFSYFLALLIAV